VVQPVALTFNSTGHAVPRVGTDFAEAIALARSVVYLLLPVHPAQVEVLKLPLENHLNANQSGGERAALQTLRGSETPVSRGSVWSAMTSASLSKTDSLDRGDEAYAASSVNLAPVAKVMEMNPHVVAN